MTELVDNLDIKDVICDVGTPVTYATATCCQSDDRIIHPTALRVLIVLGTIGFVSSISCMALFTFRKRRPFNWRHDALSRKGVHEIAMV